MKRRRRKASEIEKIRARLQEAVKKEGRISLTDLVGMYGASIGIKETISDKALAKRQLDLLASTGDIEFQRDGRDLVAEYKPPPRPAPRPQQPLYTTRPAEKAEPPPPAMPAPQEDTAEATPSPTAPNLELQAIKAYAKQVHALAETLQQQVNVLTEMLAASKDPHETPKQ